MAGRVSHAAAGRNIDYAEFSQTGRKGGPKKTLNKRQKAELEAEGELEDGQLADSPLSIDANEADEFRSEMVSTSTSLTTTDNGKELDYEDVYQDSEVHKEDEDITEDNVWKQKQDDMVATKQKLTRIKLKLEREHQLAEEKLQEEQEKLEIQRMEQEIQDLNERRKGLREQRKPRDDRRKADQHTAVAEKPRKPAPSRNRTPSAHRSTAGSLSGEMSVIPIEKHERVKKPARNVTDEVTSSSGIIQSEVSDQKHCQICGDISTGFYYSVWSCEGCKAFFKRCLQAKDGANYVCPATNTCTIDKTRRKCCQACRLRKCYEVGMQKTGSRRERSTKVQQKVASLDSPRHASKRRKKSTSGSDSFTPSSELPPPTCSASHIKSLTNVSGSPASQPVTSPASESASPESSHSEVTSPKSTSSMTSTVAATPASSDGQKSANNCETVSQEPLPLTEKDIKTEVCEDSVKGCDNEEAKASEKHAKLVSEPYEMPIHPIVSVLLDCEPPVRLTNHEPRETETEESLMTSFVKLADTELVDVITWAKSVPGYSSLAINDKIHLVDCCWMEILVCGLTWRSSQAGEGVLAFAPDLVCNRDQYYTAGIGPIGDRMVVAAKLFREMELTREEFVCFRAITLLNADLTCLEDFDSLFKARQGIVDALLYTIQNRTKGPENRLFNILLLLPHIRQCGVNATAHMFEMQHEEAFPISELVREMLQVQEPYTTK